MVAVTNLLSKYTILYGMIITLVVTIQSVARRWTANNNTVIQPYISVSNLQTMLFTMHHTFTFSMLIYLEL